MRGLVGFVAVRQIDVNQISACSSKRNRLRPLAKAKKGEERMQTGPGRLNRRAVLKAGAALGIAQIASPFLVKALGDEPVKIGLVDPLTGAYAAVAQNGVVGAKLAVDEINAKGGILGRQ